MVQSVCEIMTYWTTEWIYSRYTFLESFWFGIDGNLLHFLLIPSQEIVFDKKKKANAKNLQCCLYRRTREEHEIC